MGKNTIFFVRYEQTYLHIRFSMFFLLGRVQYLTFFFPSEMTTHNLWSFQQNIQSPLVWPFSTSCQQTLYMPLGSPSTTIFRISLNLPMCLSVTFSFCYAHFHLSNYQCCLVFLFEKTFFDSILTFYVTIFQIQV